MHLFIAIYCTSSPVPAVLRLSLPHFQDVFSCEYSCLQSKCLNNKPFLGVLGLLRKKRGLSATAPVILLPHADYLMSKIRDKSTSFKVMKPSGGFGGL